MKSFTLLVFNIFMLVPMLSNKCLAQNTGIGTTTPTAKLEIAATNPVAPANQDGILIPRIDVFPATAPTVNQNGMMVFLTTSSGTNQPGFYYWDNGSLSWKGVGANTGWGLKGNTGTDTSTNFIGTTDDNDVIFKRFNVRVGRIGLLNTSFGRNSLNPLSTGNFNTAIGAVALVRNTDGSSNTANGVNALFTNTSGSNNTASGVDALVFNSTGSNNTANGFRALFFNTTGYSNTANGVASLRANTTGIRNTATGDSALFANTTGFNNTANGVAALRFNTTGNYNIANGDSALYSNTNSNGNTATGSRSLFSNTTGSNNTANGLGALFSNTEGSGNTALGYDALRNVTVGGNNIGIGWNAQVPNAALNDQVRIGNASIVYAGIQVAWTITSDKRWKSDIQNSSLGLDFIKQLHPVSYYRNNDERKKTEFGFLAQEVEETLNKAGVTNNGIINKDDAGMYSVRYNDFIAPMVKAIQEQQEMIEALQMQVEAAKAEIPMQIGKQQEMIEELKKQNELLIKQNQTQQKINQELLKRLEIVEKK